MISLVFHRSVARFAWIASRKFPRKRHSSEARSSAMMRITASGLGAIAASNFTERELDGKRVGLEFDVQRIDPYGRTLAYVWLGDELFNETLVRQGFAFVTTYPPDVRYESRFTAAQRVVGSASLGIWGKCVHPKAGDPAYPTACIPPPPPDLDCSDIRFRRFTVLPPDPHNFDGDHNGIGCETS